MYVYKTVCGGLLVGRPGAAGIVQYRPSHKRRGYHTVELINAGWLMAAPLYSVLAPVWRAA